MTATKLKKSNRNIKNKKTKPIPLDILRDKKWEKVKIKGKVISDDCDGFEGMIGLEVLEDYDNRLVETSKPKRNKKQERKERNKAKKRTVKQALGSEESEQDDSSDDEADATDDAAASSNMTRKEKLAQRLAKQKEKREKRKLLKKQKLSENKLATSNKSSSKQQNNNENMSDNEEYPAERFALLRPPASDDSSAASTDDEQAVPELVASNAISMHELQGWNGMGVPEPILRALAEKGFKSPTEIQALTLPAAIMGKKRYLGRCRNGQWQNSGLWHSCIGWYFRAEGQKC